jgi:hypothetical protein
MSNTHELYILAESQSVRAIPVAANERTRRSQTPAHERKQIIPSSMTKPSLDHVAVLGEN